MALEEVIEYVAEMTDRPVQEVRLSVDNTLTAAWLHDFVRRDGELYFLESIVKPDVQATKNTRSKGSATTFAHFTGTFDSCRGGRRIRKQSSRRW